MENGYGMVFAPENFFLVLEQVEIDPHVAQMIHEQIQAAEAAWTGSSPCTWRREEVLEILSGEDPEVVQLLLDTIKRDDSHQHAVITMQKILGPAPNNNQ